ncbi:MAG: hypothetical protein ABIH46_10455 [Chloroflexota bacterium]
MAFRILATAEPLLKKGHYVNFIGHWGDKYEKRFYQITHLIQFERDYRAGYLPAAATSPYSINPNSDMGFEPVYYDTIYQVRIGISQGWNMYLRWPTGDYRGKLEDPDFVTINPVATDGQKYIGVMSAAKPIFGTSAGVMTTLEDATLTDGPTVPYDQVLWLNRIEVSNKFTEDLYVVGYDTFTDTDGTARTVELFNYKLVAGQTVGVDVEKSKKVLAQLKFQVEGATPTEALPVKVFVGGELEMPKLDRWFEMFFVKDWMPLFYASVNSLLDYEKLLLCCLVNKLKIVAVEGDEIRRKLESGEVPSYPLYHYSEYESKSL